MTVLSGMEAESLDVKIGGKWDVGTVGFQCNRWRDTLWSSYKPQHKLGNIWYCPGWFHRCVDFSPKDFSGDLHMPSSCRWDAEARSLFKCTPSYWASQSWDLNPHLPTLFSKDYQYLTPLLYDVLLYKSPAYPQNSFRTVYLKSFSFKEHF